MAKQRYQIYGYYTDEPQVVVDVVDAESLEEAEAIITAARGGDRHGYTVDGGGLLEEELENLKDLLQRPAEDIAKGIAELAAQYAEEDED